MMLLLLLSSIKEHHQALGCFVDDVTLVVDCVFLAVVGGVLLRGGSTIAPLGVVDVGEA